MDFTTTTKQQQQNNNNETTTTTTTNNKQPSTSNEIKQSLTFELLDKSYLWNIHFTTKTIIWTKERPLGLKRPRKIGQRSIHFWVSDIPFSHLNEKGGKHNKRHFWKKAFVIRNIVSLKWFSSK
jgi:hypothetical protein